MIVGGARIVMHVLSAVMSNVDGPCVQFVSPGLPQRQTRSGPAQLGSAVGVHAPHEHASRDACGEVCTTRSVVSDGHASPSAGRMTTPLATPPSAHVTTTPA